MHKLVLLAIPFGRIAYSYAHKRPMSMFIHRGHPRIAQPTAVTMLARRAAYHVLLRDSTAEAAIDDTFRVQRGELRSASQRMTGRSSPARSHESTEPATAPYFTDETVSSS